MAAWPAEPVSAAAWQATIALAVICTGAAYIVFFRLIANVGPTGAVSVTFLVPIFGVVWGSWFLDEPVTMSIALGAGIILAGTALALGLLRPRVSV
ncbi:EamA-like transporter family protein [compost metagenome]